MEENLNLDPSVVDELWVRVVAQEMLRYGVAPARVMEAFASRLFVLLREGTAENGA